MEECVKKYLETKGYKVNNHAQTIIGTCEDWYANRLTKFHRRMTAQGVEYNLHRMGFGKRCCTDDANLCEVVEISAEKKEITDYVNKILDKSEFQNQYRKQLEKTSGLGTSACYIRLDNADIYASGRVEGGEIKLNYVDADGFIPLTVENDIVREAAFTGASLVKGKTLTTLVMFTLDDGMYQATTINFDDKGNKLDDEKVLHLGEVKPFAVMRTAAVNNIDNMTGYGMPKLWDAIPVLECLDMTYNILFSDLDKGEKLVLVNEALCKFDANGNELTPNEQIKKVFLLLGEKLPSEKTLIQEYNPKLRIDDVTKALETLLSLLSMMFGYGTKKYTFENGQITTATEYIGQKQDQMQELNRQRLEAAKYIRDIIRAILWYSDTFQSKGYDVNTEFTVDFNDSYITDREAELDRKRNDALSFDLPKLKIWYLMDAYSLTEEEATEMVMRQEEPEPEEENPEE